ncbi:hypothetical protein LTR85_009906 [Meristemomyces frigidus]|nr:hypothetical protein LTR85_009906 [Meristemomyces frigidus]
MNPLKRLLIILISLLFFVPIISQMIRLLVEYKTAYTNLTTTESELKALFAEITSSQSALEALSAEVTSSQSIVEDALANVQSYDLAYMRDSPSTTESVSLQQSAVSEEDTSDVAIILALSFEELVDRVLSDITLELALFTADMDSWTKTFEVIMQSMSAEPTDACLAPPPFRSAASAESESSFDTASKPTETEWPQQDTLIEEDESEFNVTEVLKYFVDEMQTVHAEILTVVDYLVGKVESRLEEGTDTALLTWSIGVDEDGVRNCDTRIPTHLDSYAAAALRFNAGAFCALPINGTVKQSVTESSTTIQPTASAGSRESSETLNLSNSDRDIQLDVDVSDGGALRLRWKENNAELEQWISDFAAEQKSQETDRLQLQLFREMIRLLSPMLYIKHFPHIGIIVDEATRMRIQNSQHTLESFNGMYGGIMELDAAPWFGYISEIGELQPSYEEPVETLGLPPLADQPLAIQSAAGTQLPEHKSPESDRVDLLLGYLNHHTRLAYNLFHPMRPTMRKAWSDLALRVNSTLRSFDYEHNFAQLPFSFGELFAIGRDPASVLPDIKRLMGVIQTLTDPLAAMELMDPSTFLELQRSSKVLREFKGQLEEVETLREETEALPVDDVEATSVSAVYTIPNRRSGGDKAPAKVSASGTALPSPTALRSSSSDVPHAPNSGDDLHGRDGALLSDNLHTWSQLEWSQDTEYPKKFESLESMLAHMERSMSETLAQLGGVKNGDGQVDTADVETSPQAEESPGPRAKEESAKSADEPATLGEGIAIVVLTAIFLSAVLILFLAFCRVVVHMLTFP